VWLIFGEIAELNSALGDFAANVTLIESMAPSDPRRSAAGISVFDDWLELGRYEFALSFKSPESMNAEFTAASRSFDRQSAVRIGASYVEALAGGGRLTEARTLAARILDHDNFESTRSVLRNRLMRAGQPTVLNALR
jgi:hypothetical protein